MKLPLALAVAACAALLLVVVGSGRQAYAQNAVVQNAGLSTGEADESTPEDKAPIDIGGCWMGTTDDETEGKGSVAAIFTLASHQRNFKEKPSVFYFNWNSGFYVFGHLKGSVDSTGITFEGHVREGYPVSNCPVSGSGTGDDSEITGVFKFEGECAKEFRSGSFSITHLIGVICQFDREQ